MVGEPSPLTRHHDAGQLDRMNAIFGIGAGAGLASALLFAVITTGNPLAVLLYFVAPLPVILAALGWNHRAGLVAAACGFAFVALLLSVKAGLAFVLSVAAPAWWFAYLCLLARQENGSVEWYPIGRLLMWIALLSAILTTAVSVSIGRGDYAAFLRAFEQILDVLRRLGT